MSSSEESFGWSAVSIDNMSSSEDDNASECSSLLDRKLQKKNLRKNLSPSKQNGGVCSEGYIEERSVKKKKKKKVKVEKDSSDLENNLNNSRNNKSIKSEPDETPRDKIIKKKNIKTEPEESTADSTKRKKSKKDKSLSPPDIIEHEVNLVKQEKSDGSIKKKKKKKELTEQEETCHLPVDDAFTIPAVKKKHKKNTNQSDITINDDKINMGYVNGHADETDTSENTKSKKKKKLSFSTPINTSDDLPVETNEQITSTEVSEKGKRLKQDKYSRVDKLRNSSVSSGGRRDSISSNCTRKLSTSSNSSSKRRRSSASSQDSRKQPSSSSSSDSENQISISNDRNKSNSSVKQMATQDNRKSFPLSKVESSKRTSLSERILFEDEPDRPIDSENDLNARAKRSNSSKKIQKFIQCNPKLNAVSSAGLKVGIGNQDEAWLIKCPKDFNHRNLKDMVISIQNKSKIKLDGQTFEGDLEEKSHRVAVLCPSVEENTFVIQDINISGTLIFRKRIPKVPVNDINVAVPKETFIPLPETKRRHPLFGHDYRKLIKIPTSVAERLADTAPRKKLKSKRKHKDEIQGESSMNGEHPEVTFDEVDSSTKKKKKRKRKHSEEADSDTVVKKFKCDPEWDSEQAIKSFLQF